MTTDAPRDGISTDDAPTAGAPLAASAARPAGPPTGGPAAPVDLRSDTVTRPTAGMRRAMA
jgi:threonine aldolase